MSKQAKQLLEYLLSGADLRSPSMKNMLEKSGYANNRALVDGLKLLERKGKITHNVNGYWPVANPIRFYPNGYESSGGTS